MNPYNLFQFNTSKLKSLKRLIKKGEEVEDEKLLLFLYSIYITNNTDQLMFIIDDLIHTNSLKVKGIDWDRIKLIMKELLMEKYGK